MTKSSEAYDYECDEDCEDCPDEISSKCPFYGEEQRM